MMMFQEGGIEWVDDLGGEIIEDSWIGKQLSKFCIVTRPGAQEA